MHQPGAREKFGFSTPGPDAFKLAQPESCLEEAVDIPNPRMHQSLPRYQEPDDQKIFQHLDIPEMQRSYVSPVAKMSVSQGFGGRSLRGDSFLSRSTSLPVLGKTIVRMTDPHPPVGKVEDDHFSYFVPKTMARTGMDKLKSTNLSKLQKRDKITMPLGSGTGFPFQASQCAWWPTHIPSDADSGTSYRDSHLRPPFHRMSPLDQ